MASVKIASLLIKTISKPIANQLKKQAQDHESFRSLCVGLAQVMHKSEVKLRTNVMGESKTSIRPLIESKAVTNGATALAEGFLLFVGVSLIGAEAYRSSRSQSKRRDDVDDRLEELKHSNSELLKMVETLREQEEAREKLEDGRADHVSSILSQIVTVGLRGGWIDASKLPSPLPTIPSADFPFLTTLPHFPSDDTPVPSPGASDADLDPLDAISAVERADIDAFFASRKTEPALDEGYVEDMIDGRVHVDDGMD